GVDEQGGDQGGEAHGEERGQEAGDAPLIEPAEAEAVAFAIAKNNGGNEIAGYHEKDVHAHESARQPSAIQVEQEDGEDCHGSQSVDGRSVLGGGRNRKSRGRGLRRGPSHAVFTVYMRAGVRARSWDVWVVGHGRGTAHTREDRG